MAKWTIDPAHSELAFQAKHLMINKVKGHFNKFEGTVETSADDFKDAKVLVTADITSIDTGNEQRDQHLRTADFFDVEKNPQLKFESTSFDGKVLKGDLTIAGTTKPVTLNVEFGGIAKDPWGNTKAGFTVTGKINRKDWGMNWNTVLETGGLLVSDEISINAEVQFAKQA